ncbi:MAG: FAD-dependent oxidoreductase [Lachnospiraceae bacterium]
MSKIMIKAYAEEMEQGYDYRRAMEEASRCLLCHDAPCSKGCPAGTNPAKFIRSFRFKNIKGAAETIRENNPLAGSCARICPYGRLCEEACSRCGIDKPINIGKIQRFLVEEEEKEEMNFIKPEAKNGKKVACIGAGPASLSCARELALKGYEVTVYEEKEQAGGVLTYGIVPTRLPQKVVDFDISLIEKAGVKFKFKQKIDLKRLEELKKEYNAVFVGIGLWKSKTIDIAGMDLDGVVSAMNFLEKSKMETKTVKLKDNVIVIGGGDVAMDCVTTAKQLGAKNAMIIYRRTVEEAPADMDEVSFVQNMGIPIFTQFAPKEIIGKNGKVSALRCIGRDGESEMTVKADQIIFAIGQELASEYAEVDFGSGVYIGGDMAHGKGKTVVEAVADGKEAAVQIETYLS